MFWSMANQHGKQLVPSKLSAKIPLSRAKTKCFSTHILHLKSQFTLVVAHDFYEIDARLLHAWRWDLFQFRLKLFHQTADL